MDNLVALRHFVYAVEQGSLSGAARRLGLSQPAVSQQIASLETSLGQTLLVRTRTGVKATEAGRVLLRYGEDILASLARMEDEMAALSGEIAGPLKVTANVLFCQTLLVPVIGELRRNHPRLKIEVVSSDEVLDVVEHGIDIAIRGGSLGDGSGIARRIGSLEQALVASPTYLDRVGRPRVLADLKRLDFIQYKDDPGQQHLPVIQDGIQVPAPITAAFAAQMPNLVLHAVVNHFGFALVPVFLVAPMLSDGRLEPVLPGISPLPKNLYLVQQPHVAESRRARLFVSRLLAEMSASPALTLTSDARAQAMDYLEEIERGGRRTIPMPAQSPRAAETQPPVPLR